MRVIAGKLAAIAAFVLVLLVALPRVSRADQRAFGDIVVHYSALSTDQLLPVVAQKYGIERSARDGLVNIAIERKGTGGDGAMIAATVAGSVADLAGHSRPIRFRETREEGAVDYLGEFPLDGSGTYVFTIEVTPPGRARAYTIRFNHDYVLD